MLKLIRRFWRDEQGASIIEYAILAAAIAMGSVVIVGSIGVSTEASYASLANSPFGGGSGGSNPGGGNPGGGNPGGGNPGGGNPGGGNPGGGN